MPSSASAHFFFLAEAYREAGRKADAEREKTEFEKAKVQQDHLGVPALHPSSASTEEVTEIGPGCRRAIPQGSGSIGAASVGVNLG